MEKLPGKYRLSGRLGDQKGVLVEYFSEYVCLAGAEAVNRRLLALAREGEKQAVRLLVPARRQRQLQGAAGGFRPYGWQGMQTAVRRGPVTSLCRDVWEDRGLLGKSWRRDSFFLDEKGHILPGRVLFRGNRPEKRIWELVKPQAEALAADGCSLYADWRRRLPGLLSPDRCCFAEEGLTVYCPPGTLGPLAAGAPAFLIPEQKLGDLLCPGLLNCKTAGDVVK